MNRSLFKIQARVCLVTELTRGICGTSVYTYISSKKNMDIFKTTQIENCIINTEAKSKHNLYGNCHIIIYCQLNLKVLFYNSS